MVTWTQNDRMSHKVTAKRNAMKRIESTVPEGEAIELVEVLEATHISGDTIIPSVAGRDGGGRVLQALGQLDNSYLLDASDSEKLLSAIEAPRPFLKRCGGRCLISDAHRGLH